MNQPKERLYRSRKEKIIGGVCGGLAEYFDVDPVIIRIIFVLLGLFKGIGLIVYFIMLIIVPFRPSTKDKFSNMESSSGNDEPEVTDAEVEDAEIIDETEESENNSSTNFASSNKTTPPARYDSKSILGISLVVIGAVLLLDKIFPVLTFKILVPVVLIIVGIYFLIDNKKKVSHENR
jgi:phage shock protein C